MREERGNIAGDVVVYEEFTLWGAVLGNVKVINGGRFYIRGVVYGDLLVDRGGRVHIFGQVSGNLRLEKYSKTVNSGLVGGDLINDGGRYFGDPGSRVLGKIKTHTGDTKLPDAR
jgi:hypothetical protein